MFGRFVPRSLYWVLGLFYVSVYFSTSNRMLLVLSVLCFLFVWRCVKDLGYALFLMMLVTLPFAKGKGLDFTLLPKDQIERYALFPISYVFPVYLTDIYLFLLYILYLRRKILGKERLLISIQTKRILVVLLVFIIIALQGAFRVYQSEIIILSAVQLLRMMCVFFSPFLLRTNKSRDQNFFYQTIAVSLLFQSFWVILQRINGGPLGRDIEVFISGSEYGVRSSENSDIYRSAGTFFESSILGTFLLVHITILFTQLLQHIRKVRLAETGYAGSIVLGIVAIVFTGSRGIYVLLVGMFLVLVIVYKDTALAFVRKVSKKWVILVCLLLVLLTPFVALRLEAVADLFSQYGSGTYRIQMLQYALRLSSIHPLGVGINLSPYYLATAFPQEVFIFDPTYPHSLFFQLVAEVGVVGFIFFLLFLYLIYRPVLGENSARWTPFHLGALVFLLCAQFYPIFLNHPEISSFLFLYLGLAAQRNSYD